MITKKFSNALGNIGENYVDEAATYTAKKKNNVWVKWGSIAACFALLLCIGIPLTLHLIPSGDIGDDHGAYPFETLEVGESMTYDNGTISYDEHNGTSIIRKKGITKLPMTSIFGKFFPNVEMLSSMRKTINGIVEIEIT